MSFYDLDTDEVGKQLLPPRLRQLRFLAWVKVLLAPLKWAHDDFFNEYCATTADQSFIWDSATTYNVDERVLWLDKRGYVSLQNGCLNIQPTGSANSADYWLEFTTNYVAVDERAYYTPQLIFFVKALNDYFRTGAFKIYISGTTIYIPVAQYLVLGATNTERDRAVLDYANKFMLAGIDEFTVSSY